MPKYELIQNHIFQQSVQHNYQNYFDRIHVLNSGKIFIDVSNFFRKRTVFLEPTT